MEISGIVKTIMPEQQVSASYKKRELVVTTDEQFPQHVIIEFPQDKCDFLSNLTVGQKVTVFINIKGREWVSPSGEVKYFNTVQGWKIS